ncbi:hypothetical protein V7S78_12070, partial [Aquirufa regiilacus]
MRYLSLLLFAIIIPIGCKIDEPQNSQQNPPTVITYAATEIIQTSVTLNGEVANEGFSAASERGFVYSDKNINPSVSDMKIQSGYGAGNYTYKLSNLITESQYYYKAYATNSKGTSYGEIQKFKPTEPQIKLIDKNTKIIEVKSKTGKIWMDRNLGASQVATTLFDEKAIGDLYQWGRGADGHQFRTSKTISTLSKLNNPGHSDFIATDKSPFDWREGQNDKFWQGVDGINNPCPNGFRIPTIDEWNNERLTWISDDANGAFNSPLKLPFTSDRAFSHGGVGWLDDGGGMGTYWSSTTEKLNTRSIFFNAKLFRIDSYVRAHGRSIRCIKD